MFSKEKTFLISEYFLLYGEEKTLKTFDIKNETLQRTLREYKNKYKQKEKFDNAKYMKEIENKYSKKDLQNLAKGQRLSKEKIKVVPFDFTGKHVRFAAITDTHIGSIYFIPEIWDKIVKEIKKEKCEFVTHSGDIVDGMFRSHAGQIYELTHLGYENQKQFAIDNLSMLEKPLYVISGNHDRTFMKDVGGNIVKDIASSIKDCYFLGHDEGDLPVNNIIIKLWHGEDSSSYAISYRLQKVVEAFTGGEKPEMLIAGHTHKQGYFFIRHVQVISAGACCKQSAWMRSKRLANHMGFWIIDLYTNSNKNTKYGISKITTTWFPIYN